METALTKIARKIIASGEWPALWKLHWICPLFKKGITSNSQNYRGIHLTSRVSKIIERIIAHIFITPYVTSMSLYGENQFAYTKARGSRDALAYFVLSCLLAFARGHKVAFYQADVAGAFDRVDSRILLQKCRRTGLHPKISKLLSSWLRGRTAHVVCGGKKSGIFNMTDMVFQGIVLGPLL